MVITPEYLMYTDEELRAVAELESQINKFLQETYKRPVRFVEHCPAYNWNSWTGKFFTVDEGDLAWNHPGLRQEVLRRFTSAGWKCYPTRNQIGLKPEFMDRG